LTATKLKRGIQGCTSLRCYSHCPSFTQLFAQHKSAGIDINNLVIRDTEIKTQIPLIPSMITIILITSQQRLNSLQNLDSHHRFFLSKPFSSLPQQRKLCVILSFGYSITDIDIYYKWTNMVAKG